MQKRSSGGNRENNRERAENGLGLAIWIVVAIVLFIMFIVNQGKIVSNLKQTGFFGRVFGKTPSFVENAPSSDSQEKNDVAPVTTNGAKNTGELNLITTGSHLSSLIDQDDDESANATDNATGLGDGENLVTSADENTVANLGRTMDIKLYFMSINSDGSVMRKEITRSMPKSSSPLVDAVNALIAGPTLDEEREGCKTLVSNGTQLISATLKNGIATLNFSGEFEFNQYGIEGTRGQLQQIVYTATAFSSVEKVQFLVDGEKREYLGSEGVWIGTPLSRNSF